MSAKPKQIEKPNKLDDNLPTLYIDGVIFRHRDDGMNLVSFMVDLPDIEKEQARIMVDDKHLQLMLDIMCQEINHFPEKKTPKAKSPSKEGV